MLKNCRDAGLRLAAALESYREQDSLVLSVSNQALPLAIDIASRLACRVSFVLSQQLNPPDSAQCIGALAEDGSIYILEPLRPDLSCRSVRQLIEKQRRHLAHRIENLRPSCPLPELAGQVVILVAAHILTGSTMRVSLTLCRNRCAARVIIASISAAPAVPAVLSRLCDKVIVLEAGSPSSTPTPEKNTPGLSDSDMIKLLSDHHLHALAH